jgi:hypothetical protein
MCNFLALGAPSGLFYQQQSVHGLHTAQCVDRFAEFYDVLKLMNR